MGQIKNIKLHIVTDIKLASEKHDKGNHQFWQTPQQVSHLVCAMWAQVLPHPEENMCILWLPKCKDQKLRLGLQGQEKKDDRHWTHATSEESAAQKYEWISGRNICEIAEENCCTVDELSGLAP